MGRCCGCDDDDNSIKIIIERLTVLIKDQSDTIKKMCSSISAITAPASENANSLINHHIKSLETTIGINCENLRETVRRVTILFEERIRIIEEEIKQKN
jgi:hypothetical protein